MTEPTLDEPECSWSDNGKHQPGMGRDRGECRYCDTALPVTDGSAPTDAGMTPEQWVRHLAQGWGGTGGEKIAALLAEYDRRAAALAYAEELGRQVIRAEAQAVRDLEEELVGVRSQRDAALALHRPKVINNSEVCGHCSMAALRGKVVAQLVQVLWPCPTAVALGMES